MILGYECRYANGKRVEAEVEFDARGNAAIRWADDAYMRKALEEALKTPIRGETSEYRDGALATGPIIAQPGTVEHALAMINPHMLLSKGIVTFKIEGEMLRG